MHAAVVGAGIIGRLLAYQLVKNHWRVSIFEKAAPGQEAACSQTAAGLLCPYLEPHRLPPAMIQLGAQSLKRWPEILKSLPQPVFFTHQGCLVTSPPHNHTELEHFQRQLHQQTATEIYQRLDTPAIKTIEPDFQLAGQALFIKDAGSVDNPSLLTLLRSTLIEQNVAWHHSTAIHRLSPHRLDINQQHQSFDMVFDCRGLGAKTDYPSLRGVRGEVICCHAPEVSLTRPIVLLHPRHAVYIVPRGHHQFVIGATEIESEDFRPITVRSTLELLSGAYTVHRGFAEASIINTLVSCRPAFPDNLPKIIYQDGLIAINGLFRYGYSFGPVIIDQVMTLIKQGPAHCDYPLLLEKHP